MKKIKYLYLFIFITFINQITAATFDFEKDPIFQKVVNSLDTSKPDFGAYLLSNEFRLDLSLIDLVDQFDYQLRQDKKIIARNELKDVFLQNFEETKTPAFLRWYKKVKELTLAKKINFLKLNKNIYFQLYNASSQAIIPETKMFNLKKIFKHKKYLRINRYNKIAQDPENIYLLDFFISYNLKRNFISQPLTVAKMRSYSDEDIKNIRSLYYFDLIKSLKNNSPSVNFEQTKFGLKITKRFYQKYPRAAKIFNTIYQMPNKIEVLRKIQFEKPDLIIEQENGHLTLGFNQLQNNTDEIEVILKDYTFQLITRSGDDDYIQSARKWIKKNPGITIEIMKEKSISQKWNIKKLPSRNLTVELLPHLLEKYPSAPWYEQEIPVLISRKGKDKFFFQTQKEKNKYFFKNLGREIAKPQNYLSILAGTAVSIATAGNLMIGVGVKGIIKEYVSHIYYDHPSSAYLKSIPKVLSDAILWGSGFVSGRLFRIIALGAASGAVQSALTKQDIKIGALIGASLNLVQFYLIPLKYSRPMVKESNPNFLMINRGLEVAERSVKGASQAAIVALIEGEDVSEAAKKGTIYGSLNAALHIWFYGTRYNPFRTFNSNQIDNYIQLENDYNNIYGRGGHYAIDRQLIFDAQYRVGGALPEWITASITMPGNIAMSSWGYNSLKTMVHEAKHLMQQMQSGVFEFYLFRYLPSAFKYGYANHPDEVGYF